MMGGDKLARNIFVLWSNPEILQSSVGKRFRKISYFPDKEDKVRVIAQGDYFSQTCLRPLHSYLYNCLRKIPQDCTFDQGSFKTRKAGSDIYYSVDLSAATDRFPISVISHVLKGLLPSWYVSLWESIKVGYPFNYRAPNSGVDDMISYSVGNPMGFYSSWASFAIAHHFLVYDVCCKLGVEWTTLQYALLGDDIVIAHKEVAELYIQRLSD